MKIAKEKSAKNVLKIEMWKAECASGWLLITITVHLKIDCELHDDFTW